MIFFHKKPSKKNFFELSAEEKKKIITKATDGANELQRELVGEFDKKYPSKAGTFYSLK
jgi:hypothetical protein